MAKQIQHVLEAAGLHPREARLYLAGLQVGSAPASEYAKLAKLNRVTAYNTLEDLVKKGYFTIEKKVRAKWYAPVAPEYLAVEARKNAEALDQSLPELRSLRGAEHRRPHVRFFEGWEGVRRVYEDTFTAKGELLNFANSAVLRKYWPAYDAEYVAERVKRGIHLRGIAPDDATGRRVQGMDKDSLREIRLVSAKDFDFRNEINIYGNKVSIVTLGEDEENLFGVIIESKEVAETQRQIFEMAWRYAGGKQ
ncbi:MAG TPA: helix-turn-helix domain-containing protein [Candidatus Peribacteraceae bacterium]|nr:helix-turn-helix domain-containing protein [Candidatus Peribacteraceae bacterium]